MVQLPFSKCVILTYNCVYNFIFVSHIDKFSFFIVILSSFD